MSSSLNPRSTSCTRFFGVWHRNSGHLQSSAKEMTDKQQHAQYGHRSPATTSCTAANRQPECKWNQFLGLLIDRTSTPRRRLCEGHVKFTHYKIVFDEDELSSVLEAVIVLTSKNPSRDIIDFSVEFVPAKPSNGALQEDHTIREWGETS